MKNEELIEKINNLSESDLAFFKQMVSFFDTLGMNVNDLGAMVQLSKAGQELIDKINLIINDQKYLNEQLLKVMKGPVEGSNVSDPLSEFNKERQKLNIYGE